MHLKENDLLLVRRSQNVFVEQVISPQTASVISFNSQLQPVVVPSLSLPISYAKNALSASYASTIPHGTFTSNLLVNLKDGKSFGRYQNGETIPSSGKTPSEVIELAIQEFVNPPIVSLTSPTIIKFFQESIVIELNFNYTVNPPSVFPAKEIRLEYRRNNFGSWNNTYVESVYATTYTYYHMQPMDWWNEGTWPFNFRYIVTDSDLRPGIATFNVTPLPYIAPTISLSVVGTSIVQPETNTIRERGNTSSSLSGVITKNTTNNSSNLTLTAYSVEFQINGGEWSNVPGLANITITGNPTSVTIPSTLHAPTSVDTTNIKYRVKVTDLYQHTYSSITTISLLYMIYYGSVAVAPTNSSGVRALGTRIFIDGINPYNLLTGTTHAIFTSAMPSTYVISEVLDLDASNSNITSNYIQSLFNVNDAGGNAINYNVYTMTNATPYTLSHRHQTTRAVA